MVVEERELKEEVCAVEEGISKEELAGGFV